MLDDPDKINEKLSRVIIELQTQYISTKERNKDKPNQKSEDFYI